MRRLLSAALLIMALFSLCSPPASAQPVVLQRTFFVMPSDGVRNNNSQIGDFCCTGSTATILTTSGIPVGYMYAYDFRGGVNFGDGTSGFGAIGLKISAISDGFNPSSRRYQGDVWFSAGEVSGGITTKSIQVGALFFQVRLSNFRMRDNRITGDVTTEVSIQVR
jgi:hypothetical protein